MINVDLTAVLNRYQPSQRPRGRYRPSYRPPATVQTSVLETKSPPKILGAGSTGLTQVLRISAGQLQCAGVIPLRRDILFLADEWQFWPYF